ncbi:MAG: type IV pilin protein, partial [Thiomonas sp.]
MNQHAPSPRGMHRLWSAGFSLIELMIVVAVIAVIAAIGYPSYVNSVVKTKRAAAAACVAQYAAAMERYYTVNLRYDQDPGGNKNGLVGKPPPEPLDCSSAQNSGADYDFSVDATNDTFTATANPKGAQLSRDTACGALS